jgi:hypothetical protein
MFPAPRFVVAVVLAGSAAAPLRAQLTNQPAGAPVPEGYRLVAEQHFDTAAALGAWAFSDPAAWRHAGDGQSFALELVKQSQYQPPFRSPFNLAAPRDVVVGDFVLEADLLQTGREYGHRDMCLFFGIQDAAHFYYVHLATAADDHAHNVFVVDGAPRAKLTTPAGTGVNWGQNVWHRLRLERRLADGSIRVFFDDLTTPVMVAADKRFGAGWIGFGSFDDVGKVDNVRLWSPSAPEIRAIPFLKSAQP